jgi:hypothetical protein
MRSDSIYAKAATQSSTRGEWSCAVLLKFVRGPQKLVGAAFRRLDLNESTDYRRWYFEKRRKVRVPKKLLT